MPHVRERDPNPDDLPAPGSPKRAPGDEAADAGQRSPAASPDDTASGESVRDDAALEDVEPA